MSFFTDKKETSRIGCKKCGFAGHLAFQCRNLIPMQPNKKPITFQGSDESEEDLNYFTPLQELNMQEQKAQAEEKRLALEKSNKAKRKHRKEKKKLKKKHKKRSKSSSSETSSSSEVSSDSSNSTTSSDEKYKKSKKKKILKRKSKKIKNFKKTEEKEFKHL